MVHITPMVFWTEMHNLNDIRRKRDVRDWIKVRDVLLKKKKKKGQTVKDEERQVKGDSRDVMTKRRRAPGSAPGREGQSGCTREPRGRGRGRAEVPRAGSEGRPGVAREAVLVLWKDAGMSRSREDRGPQPDPPRPPPPKKTLSLCILDYLSTFRETESGCGKSY